jgi:hypothetical protein
LACTRNTHGQLPTRSFASSARPRWRGSAFSVQIYSEDSLGKSRPRLTSKFPPHRRSLPLAGNRGPVPMPHMGPGLRGCNPIGLHRPFATNYAIPAQAGTHSAASVELSDGTRSQKRSNSGACGSMGPGLRRDGEKR